MLVIGPATAAPHKFGAGQAHGAGEDDGQGPGRADPDARAVVAEAGGRHHKDALKLGRKLEQVNPSGEVPQPEGRVHVVDAWHSGDALVESHQCLDVEPHSRALPDGLCVANKSERCATCAHTLEAADDG
eukprot:3332431-Prymnesium_polylepis.5